MVAVSLTSIFIISFISLSLNFLLFVVVIGRTNTVIQQIIDFDEAVATLYTKINEVVARFEAGGEFSEPPNPIQMILAQFLQKKMEDMPTINNRNELGQFKTIEAK
jgi:hypothetical protein